MSKTNKFGFDPIEPPAPKSKSTRKPGPMGAAVRETAENLSEATESKLEQRKQNASDAKAYREAEADGLLLRTIPLDEIHTDDLPRDRLELEAVATSDEMDELKASIRARGQKEPVEIYEGDDGRYQLKKGWRRFTALSQLFAETGDPDFGFIVARMADRAEVRLARYIDMVEENVVREDLSFAEMAQVALAAAADPKVIETNAEEVVGRLYASLHKMKRSYIRSFVFLMNELGDVIGWPKDISRNLGVEVARALKSGQGDVAFLRVMLEAAEDAAAQAVAFEQFLQGGSGATEPSRSSAKPRREKFEFHVGQSKVTARKGECRIVSKRDFTSVPRERLEVAIEAFEAALDGK